MIHILDILIQVCIPLTYDERGNSMETHHQIAKHLGKTRSNPALQFTPAMFNLTKTLAPQITSASLSKDFTGSTAVGGKRGIGYREANKVVKRPVVYVPYQNRESVLQKSKAARERLGIKGKHSRASFIAAGGPTPNGFDVVDSEKFDIYEALCKALGVPLGTFVDSKVYSDAERYLRSPGFSTAELDDMNAKLGLRGDKKLDNYSTELKNHPKSRIFNVSYENRLRGAVLTALGVIPMSSRNLNDVLRELDGQSVVSFGGKAPKQTRAKSIEERRAELSTPTSTNTNVVVEEAPISDDSGSTDAASDEGEVTEGEESDDSSEKKSKKGWIIGGIAAVVVLGGVGYYLMSEQ